MTTYSESSENVRKKTPKINVVAVYAGLLHRAPTTTELGTYQPQALTAIIEAVRSGAAYRARVA